MKRLRLAHLIVQPVLVWDDGDELQPGPPANPIQLPLSQLASLAVTLPMDLESLAAQLAESEQPTDVSDTAADAGAETESPEP